MPAQEKTRDNEPSAVLEVPEKVEVQHSPSDAGASDDDKEAKDKEKKGGIGDYFVRYTTGLHFLAQG